MSSIDNNKKITKVKLSKKFVKGIEDDLILPTVNWDDFLEDNWCYIYPNGGTAENPANITNNSSYVMDNPFPNYIVNCIPEILYNNEWGTSEFTQQGFGFAAHQHNNNKIVLVTGYYYLINVTSTRNQYYLYTWDTVDATITTAPCRVKVYKIGKIKR